jgi:hypothetical protein
MLSITPRPSRTAPATASLLGPRRPAQPSAPTVVVPGGADRGARLGQAGDAAGLFAIDEAIASARTTISPLPASPAPGEGRRPGGQASDQR